MKPEALKARDISRLIDTRAINTTISIIVDISQRSGPEISPMKEEKEITLTIGIRGNTRNLNIDIKVVADLIKII